MNNKLQWLESTGDVIGDVIRPDVKMAKTTTYITGTPLIYLLLWPLDPFRTKKSTQDVMF